MGSEQWPWEPRLCGGSVSPSLTSSSADRGHPPHKGPPPSGSRQITIRYKVHAGFSPSAEQSRSLISKVENSPSLFLTRPHSYTVGMTILFNGTLARAVRAPLRQSVKTPATFVKVRIELRSTRRYMGKHMLMNAVFCSSLEIPSWLLQLVRPLAYHLVNKPHPE